MFPIAKRRVEHVALVEDAAIAAAQRVLWDKLRLVAEPGGAAAFAALLSGRYTPRADETVGIVLCGGNTSAVDFGADQMRRLGGLCCGPGEVTFREADNPRGLQGAGLPRELTAAMEEDHRRIAWMPNRPPSSGTASVSTFASRARGSSCRAAASNAGAIIRQGPHQGAQKSTSTGISLFSSAAGNAPRYRGRPALPRRASTCTCRRPHAPSPRGAPPGGGSPHRSSDRRCSA